MMQLFQILFTFMDGKASKPMKLFLKNIHKGLYMFKTLLTIKAPTKTKQNKIIFITQTKFSSLMANSIKLTETILDNSA